MADKKKFYSTEADRARRAEKIRSLFDNDPHPHNDSKITSMSSFLAAIALDDEDDDIFQDMESEESRAKKAKLLDRYKRPAPEQ